MTFLQNSQLKVIIKDEIIAGLTVFVTMAYILILNPMILSQAGIPLAFSFFATCIATALACFLLGVWAKFPLAIGPSMAINSFFVTMIVDKFNGDWSSALGSVFLSGVLLCIAAIFHLPKKVSASLPDNIKFATVTGLALLIMSVSISSSRIFNPGFLNIDNVNFFGFVFTIILYLIIKKYRVFGGSLLVIAVSSLVMDYIWPNHISDPYSINIAQIHNVLSFNNYFDSIANALLLAFLIIFDSTSTIFALTENNSLSTSNDFATQRSKTLIITGLSTMVASIFGCTNTGVYFESAAGIDARATSGICPLIVAICFLFSLLLAPYLCYIPTSVPAGILFLLAVKIASTALKINYKDIKVLIPCAITVFIVGYFKAIADGIGAGLVLYLIFNYKTEQLTKENMYLVVIMLVYWIAKFFY